MDSETLKALIPSSIYLIVTSIFGLLVSWYSLEQLSTQLEVRK